MVRGHKLEWVYPYYIHQVGGLHRLEKRPRFRDIQKQSRIGQFPRATQNKREWLYLWRCCKIKDYRSLITFVNRSNIIITIWGVYVDRMLSSNCCNWSSWNQVSSFKEKTISQIIYETSAIPFDDRLTFATVWFSKSDPRRPLSFLWQVKPNRFLSTVCLYLEFGANVSSRVPKLWASDDTWTHSDWLGIVFVTPRRDGSAGFLWSNSPVRNLIQRTCSRRYLQVDGQIN